jgi:hypothetical protein
MPRRSCDCSSFFCGTHCSGTYRRRSRRLPRVPTHQAPTGSTRILHIPQQTHSFAICAAASVTSHHPISTRNPIPPPSLPVAILFSHKSPQSSERVDVAPAPPTFNDDLDDGGRIWLARTATRRESVTRFSSSSEWPAPFSFNVLRCKGHPDAESLRTNTSRAAGLRKL